MDVAASMRVRCVDAKERMAPADILDVHEEPVGGPREKS
jgi:hypothetical protein